MSKLFNRIDNLDLTSILSENEAIDKLKESDEKYCKNCFNPFVGEGTICDSCKEALTEVTDVERTALNAVRSIDDRLAIMGCYDITELSYEEQKDLIAEVLDDEFRGWDEEIVKIICSEMGLNTSKILDGSIENEAGVDLNLGAKVDIPDDLASTVGMALLASEDEEKVVTEDSDEENEDAKGDSDIDNEETLKVDDEEKPEEDEVKDIEDKEDDSVDPTDGDNEEKSDDEEKDDEEDKDVQILIDDLQERISALKAGLEGLDKLEEVSDETTFEACGKEYTKASAESEIKSLEEELEDLSKDKNANLGNAFGDNKLREDENLDESIMTTTTVDNIDQESKDKATIEKAIELVGNEPVINNDQFRELRYKLANKDYDVIDRLKDYALVRGEDVVYTWLRAEDSKDNINENVDISIVDNNINISKDDVNINVTTNGSANDSIEPADDLNSTPVAELPAQEEPVEEIPAEELPEEPAEEPVEESDEVIFKEGVMIGNEDVKPEDLESLFAEGDSKGFTGKDWENALYSIYFSDDIWDTLDSNADKQVTSEAVKELIKNELVNNTYNKKSTTLDSLAQLLGVEVKIAESEDLNEIGPVAAGLLGAAGGAILGNLATNALSKKEEETEDLEEANYTPEEILDMIDNAEEYIDLYNAVNKIKDPALRKDIEQAVETCENDGDSIDEAKSIISSDWSSSINNESEEVTEDALQVSDVPAKVDHKRIELAKLESEDKVTYRVSYLKEDDEEIAGWDIEASSDEDAVEALNKFGNADTIADELLSAEFISTGIDGISSLNYRNTNILLSTDNDENIITINQDNEDPVIIKGESFDDVMNQLIYWFIMNLDNAEENTEEVPTEEPADNKNTEKEGE